MNTMCEQPKKNGDCGRPAVAYISGKEPTPACAWHTGQAGIGNALTLDQLKAMMRAEVASEHALNILANATHLEREERAHIASEILLANVLHEIAS